MYIVVSYTANKGWYQTHFFFPEPEKPLGETSQPVKTKSKNMQKSCLQAPLGDFWLYELNKNKQEQSKTRWVETWYVHELYKVDLPETKSQLTCLKISSFQVLS